MVEKTDPISTPLNNVTINNYKTVDDIKNDTVESRNASKLKYEFEYKDSNLNVILEGPSKNEPFKIEIKFKLPNQLDTNEIVYRICSFKEEQFLMLEIQDIELITAKSQSNIYNLFKCLINHDEEFADVFKKELNVFIKNLNQNFYDNLAGQSIFYDKKNNESISLNGENKAQFISYWKKIFDSSHLNGRETDLDNQGSENSMLIPANDFHMAKMYHTLLHSNQMLNVLQRERNMAIDLNYLIRERHVMLRYIMDEVQLDAETEIWSTKINNLKTKQRRSFKKFLQKLYDNVGKSNNNNHDMSHEDDDEIYELKEELDSFDISKEKFINIPSFKVVTDIYTQTKKLEESYTIQLGAQLKSTHNLRLIRCNIFDFCKDRFNINEVELNKGLKKNEQNEIPLLEPQAIQTAMSLYSDKLCALILLAENSFSNREIDENGEELIKNEASHTNAANWNYLTELCDINGCEFHFPSIQDQKKQAFRYASTAKKNNSEEVSDLNIGDFYITKHSNLSQVHVIFHLVSNENKRLESTSVPTSPETPNKNLKQSDLSSRHLVILGLRNILKLCIANNINTLTLPLLLTHEMNEEMTISWVMKRAELVLKCLKGFMIEFVQWGAQDSRTIQFVVPQGLMDETFHSLSNLIPTIFRESRTVNLV